MKFIREDLPRLARPIAVFVGALVLATAAPVIGQGLLKKMDAEDSAAEKSLSLANERVRQARREQENLGSYRASYGNLVKMGFIGSFRRIDLVERLEETESSLFDMQYSISPRQKVPASDFFALSVDRVVFQLSLLHEGRLLDFIGSLETGSNGISLVAGCNTERIREASGMSYEPHLKAGCTVIWATLEGLK